MENNKNDINNNNNDNNDNNNKLIILAIIVFFFFIICFGNLIKYYILSNMRNRINPRQLSNLDNNNNRAIINNNLIVEIVPEDQIIAEDNNSINENMSPEVSEINDPLNNDQIYIILESYSNIIDRPKLDDTEECIICNDNLNNEELRVFFCLHKFHKKCIDDWLTTKKTLDCPVCNQPINKFEKLESYQELIK